MKTPINIDWTPLTNIKPHPKTTRGFAAFTTQESERIRQFYFKSGLSARIIAEHLGVNHHVIYRCIHRATKGTRRELHGRKKAAYWREKARRMSGRPWIREASHD